MILANKILSLPNKILGQFICQIFFTNLLFTSTNVLAQSSLNNSDFIKIRTTLKSCLSDLWIIKKSDKGLSPVRETQNNSYIGYRYELESTKKFDDIKKASTKFDNIEKANQQRERPLPIEDGNTKLGSGRVTQSIYEHHFTQVIYFIPVSKTVTIKKAKADIFFGNPNARVVPNPVPNSTPYEFYSNEKNEKVLSSDFSILGYNGKYILFSSVLNKKFQERIIKEFKLTR